MGSRNWNYSVKKLRSSAIFRGRLKRPSPCRINSAPGRDRLRGRSKTSEKCDHFVFGAVYARAILGSWQMQSLNEKNIGVGIISKLASYFLPTTLLSWLDLQAFGIPPHDCCVVAFRSRISRLNIFVRMFIVYEGGRSLPNDIITPSVRVDSSS